MPNITEPTARKYYRLWLYYNIATLSHQNVVTKTYLDSRFLSTPELKKIHYALKNGMLIQ